MRLKTRIAAPHPPTNRLARACGLVVGAASALATCTPAAAQFPDLFEISGQYLPDTSVAGAEPAEAQVGSYDIAINVPVVLSDKQTYLVVGAAYHVDSVSFSMTPDDFIELRSFHSAELSMLLVQLLPDDWALSFRLAPGLAGDFQAIDLEMLRLNVVAMGTYTFSNKFVLGGGALTTYSFGALLPLPAIYLAYRPAANMQIEAFLPAFASARWTLWDRIEIGVRAELEGNEYAVRDRRIQRAFPCRGEQTDDPATPADERVRNADACLDHFAYSVAKAGATLGVRLWRSMWLGVFGGHTFFRRFDPKNPSNDTLPDGSNALDDGLVVRASLTWRLPND